MFSLPWYTGLAAWQFTKAVTLFRFGITPFEQTLKSSRYNGATCANTLACRGHRTNLKTNPKYPYAFTVEYVWLGCVSGLGLGSFGADNMLFLLVYLEVSVQDFPVFSSRFVNFTTEIKNVKHVK